MISEQLQKKIDRAIRLLQGFNNPDEPVEVAYSGGKDSDVILQLVRESGINYRAIYKNTTIDPPGTIKHVREGGVEVRQPKESFFKLVERKGMPSRLTRFCCSKLKEYKILNKCVIGVRKDESKAREERYDEPTKCLFLGSKENHVEAIYPILEWSKQDIVDFVNDRHIKLHPLYYRKDGTIDPNKRLGCIGCPLIYKKRRVKELKEHPAMVKAYVRAATRYFESHPHVVAVSLFYNVYEYVLRNLFFDAQSEWDEFIDNGFWGRPNCKELLEDYFNIEF